jgi:hypothetical protein
MTRYKPGKNNKLKFKPKQKKPVYSFKPSPNKTPNGGNPRNNGILRKK